MHGKRRVITICAAGHKLTVSVGHEDIFFFLLCKVIQLKVLLKVVFFCLLNIRCWPLVKGGLSDGMNQWPDLLITKFLRKAFLSCTVRYCAYAVTFQRDPFL